MQSTVARFPASAFRDAGRLSLGWKLTWLVLAVDMAWMLVGGWSISGRGLAVTLLAVAVFQAPLALRRYRCDLRIRTMAQAATLLIMFMAAAATLSYLVITGEIKRLHLTPTQPSDVVATDRA